MRAFVGSLIVAAVLAAGGFSLQAAAGRQQTLVEAERHLTALQFERAVTALDELSQSRPMLSRLVPSLDTSGDQAHAVSMGSYWQSRYDGLATSPELALMAANAAYRTVERDGGPWTAVVGKLDAVVKRYGDVLRDDPGNQDAAYNLELVVRRRAAVAAARRPVKPVDRAASGRTLHGQAGAPPEASEMKQFKMIVPMLPQEREEAEQAGRGTKPARKG